MAQERLYSDCMSLMQNYGGVSTIVWKVARAPVCEKISHSVFTLLSEPRHILEVLQDLAWRLSSLYSTRVY